MVNGDQDSWGIADDTVGANALSAAAARAFDSDKDLPLFSDPFAQYFLDVAAQRGHASQYGGIRTGDMRKSNPGHAELACALTNFTVARTKYFDDCFVDAAHNGIRQFVDLAAGLDARAWRLPELSTAVVYEIDQRGDLMFKVDAMRTYGFFPMPNYVPVPADPGEDWSTALQDAGFQDSLPTAWSIEGLLPDLSPTAQTRLFERICKLSAADSRIVADVYHSRTCGDHRIDAEEVFFAGKRLNVADWLNKHGWRTASERSVDTMARFGRPASPNLKADVLDSDFLHAHLPT
jgi:methyltransferase (TIGR00027 family)